MSDISENYKRVRERLEEAAFRADREPEDVKLVVVTKGQPLSSVKEVIEAGATIFGENYVEESTSKITALSNYPQISWHMIGHIQSRKAKRVCRWFDWVHSLDSLKLARRLNRFAAINDKILPVLMECNVSGETSKYGFRAWDETFWDKLHEEFDQIVGLPNLRINGLMTMAPFLPDAEDARPFFIKLKKLKEYLKGEYPTTSWDELSMGMSSDFEVAVEEGATLVRVGQAILGPRPK